MIISVKYKAPLNDNTGLGTASRDILRILNNDNINLGIEVIDISPKPKLVPVPKIDKEYFAEDIPIDSYDINFIFCPPYQFEDFVEEGKINIGYTMWETQNIPEHFIENVNLLDSLLVPTEENVSFFSPYFDNAYNFPLPIEKKPDEYFYNHANKNNDFTFYSIYEWTERKSPLESLQAYFLAFQDIDDVNYIMKVRGNKDEILNKIQTLKFIMKLKKYPKVEIICDEWDSSQIKDLHSSSHCYISLSKGEGWNIPLLDSFLYGNNSISTLTGVAELLMLDINTVKSDYEPVMGMIFFPHMNACQNWLIPSINSAKAEMYCEYSKWKKNPEKYYQLDRKRRIERLSDNFGVEPLSNKIYSFFSRQIKKETRNESNKI